MIRLFRRLFRSRTSADEEPVYSNLFVKALIVLFSTEKGGRRTPIFSGYRPNHAFEILDNGLAKDTHIGEITFEDSSSLAPGDTKEVSIRFLNSPYLDANLRVGTRWRLQEGAKVVGEGEILERY